MTTHASFLTRGQEVRRNLFKTRTLLISCPPVLIFLLALVLGTAPAEAQVTAPERPLDQARDRPFGTLREQAAMQQAWLKTAARHVPAGADAQARHRHVGRPDARVQRGPGVLRARRRRKRSRRGAARSTCSSTSAPRQASLACRSVRRAHRARRHVAGRRLRGAALDAERPPADVGRGPAGRAVGRRAVAGAEDRDRGAQAARDRHQPLDRVRVLRRPVERRAQRHVGGARRRRGRRSSRTPNGCRSNCIASRLPEEEAFYPPHAGARLVDDADDVLERVDHAGQDADERPGVVVAAARERPGARHVVPAERRGAAARARPRTQIGDDPIIERGDVLHCDVGITVARLNTDTQHNAYVLRPGETDAPDGTPPRARQRQRAPGHRHGRDPARANGQRDPARVAARG